MLRQRSVIRGYHAEVDLSSLGRGVGDDFSASVPLATRCPADPADTCCHRLVGSTVDASLLQWSRPESRRKMCTPAAARINVPTAAAPAIRETSLVLKPEEDESLASLSG